MSAARSCDAEPCLGNGMTMAMAMGGICRPGTRERYGWMPEGLSAFARGIHRQARTGCAASVHGFAGLRRRGRWYRQEAWLARAYRSIVRDLPAGLG